VNDNYGRYAGRAGWFLPFMRKFESNLMTIMLIMLATSLALSTRYASNALTADYAGLYQLIQPAEKL